MSRHPVSGECTPASRAGGGTGAPLPAPAEDGVVSIMSIFIETFAARGDLAHLALLGWALGASSLAFVLLRELAGAVRRFDDFVREIARFNAALGGDPHERIGDDE